MVVVAAVAALGISMVLDRIWGWGRVGSTCRVAAIGLLGWGYCEGGRVAREGVRRWGRQLSAVGGGGVGAARQPRGGSEGPANGGNACCLIQARRAHQRRGRQNMWSQKTCEWS